MMRPTLLSFLLIAASLNAATYHVETTGNDSTGDGSSGAPWLTISKAITAATAGDTISVGSGTFAGFTSSASGSVGNYISIVGSGTNATQINSTVTIANDYILLSDIEFRTGKIIVNAPATGVYLTGLWLHRATQPLKFSGGTSDCVLTNSTMTRWAFNGGFDVGGVDNLIVSNYFTENNGYDVHRANGQTNCIWRGNQYISCGTPSASVTTSTTSQTITSSGTLTWTVADSGLDFTVDDYLQITDAANSANYMRGWVTSYSGTTLQVEVITKGGSGTISNWSIEAESNGNHADIIQAFTYNSVGVLFEGNYVRDGNTQLGNVEANAGDLRDWVYRNNVFDNSRIQINIYAPGFKFYNNTVYNTAGTTGFRGVSATKGNGIPIVVLNNIFCRVGNIESAGPYSGASSGGVNYANYNLITDYADDSAKTGYSEVNGINGGYTPTQIFTDPVNHDFTLAVDSPAIGSGTNLYSIGVTNDFYGSARPSSGAMEMGAITYGGAPANPAPSAPTSPAVSANGPYSYTVSWADASSNESGFKIECSTDNATWSFIQSVAADSTSAVIASGSALSASPGSTRYFRVYAFNATGNSSVTSSVNATLDVLSAVHGGGGAAAHNGGPGISP